jgi:thiol-disulfide isomerase/thioredoxin
MLYAAFIWGVFIIIHAGAASDANDPFSGQWNVSLATGGGELSFRLDIVKEQAEYRTTIINGPEQIPEEANMDGEQLVISMPHFDSVLRLETAQDGLRGTWQKRRSKEELAVLPCVARPFEVVVCDNPEDFLGRWSVQFSDSDDQAVGIFQQFGEKHIQGTFLTTTGDYRYLHGQVVDGELTMSCFDGAHAFLFKARPDDDGGLSGVFYSGNWHQSSWKAVRDPQAELPDAFQQTRIRDARLLRQLSYPDLNGVQRSLADSELLGKVTLIELFGTWCPNCHDEAMYLTELRDKYADRGLKILGLAFELTGDFERDAKQVRRYRERFSVGYPILLAGTSDKEAATEQFPVLDRVRSFPTTLFVDQGGEIRAVYTGYSGPATGQAHQKLRERFESLIETLLEN